MFETILDSVPFRLEEQSVFEKLKVGKGTEHAKPLTRLVQEANRIGRPKACYKISFLESKEEDSVTADGVKLTSRVLRVNLEKAQRIFPYLATCGIELEDWSNSVTDVLHRYWADTMKEMALRQASQFLHEHLEEDLKPGKTSTISPGSLTHWPITEQRPLFSLLGEMADVVGVRLTDSLLMFPVKSVSGIRFPTEESFESCQLCPREICPGRKAPYDQDLFIRKYRWPVGKGENV